MSGICGVCEPGAALPTHLIERMIAPLVLQSQQTSSVSAKSIAMGVAQSWESQEVATFHGINIAIDADLNNLSEIRDLVRQKGFDVSQRSTAELLASLYVNVGPEFVQHLDGAFSIALWDSNQQRLLLYIDRFGLRSLYWRREGDRLLFGTRSDCIAAVQNQPASVDARAITQYLIFSVIPAPLSIYQGTEKISPGVCLEYQGGHVRQYQYWDVDYSESDNNDQGYWSEQVREVLRSAVHRHLTGCSNECSGAYLSGGTDSSSVVAFMSDRLRPVKTFSIYFSEAPYSEIEFAHATSQKFGARYFEQSLTPQDALAAIPKVIGYYDEPFGNSSSIGAYYCARMAYDNGVRVMLAGDGGDEIFAGNSRYADDRRFAIYSSLPKWIRKGLLEPALRLLPQNDGAFSLAPRYVKRANIPNPKRTFSYGLFLSTDPSEVFEDGFLRETPANGWMEIADRHFHGPAKASELNRQMYLDLKMILADNDLRKVNGTAEMAGVHVRYPMLDRQLVELSARIPTRLKMKGSEKRYIFKQAMRGVLPDKVLFKKKHGFGVPLAHWLLNDRQLNGLVTDVLLDSRARQRGYFRPSFFDQLLRRHKEEHTGYYGEIVWHLLALELWHRQHFDAPARSLMQ